MPRIHNNPADALIQQSALKPGLVISYREMCEEESTNSLQRGMNFRLHGGHSVILMSVRPGAPYVDRFEESGSVLVYEGHDIPKVKHKPIDPKQVDQPMVTQIGTLTANGLFHEAAQDYKQGFREAEHVKVYEKILSGVWVYNGFFRLEDSWQESDGVRSVFKFRLRSTGEEAGVPKTGLTLSQTRLIPTEVKLAVWKRDGGQCVLCQSKENLHFDHIIPFAKGGSSLVAENIQILCAAHNLSKSDKIQ